MHEVLNYQFSQNRELFDNTKVVGVCCRAYHRVTCPISSLTCPLCMSLVPIMDLTVNLASQHGLVPQENPTTPTQPYPPTRAEQGVATIFSDNA